MHCWPAGRAGMVIIGPGKGKEEHKYLFNDIFGGIDDTSVFGNCIYIWVSDLWYDCLGLPYSLRKRGEVVHLSGWIIQGSRIYIPNRFPE